MNNVIMISLTADELKSIIQQSIKEVLDAKKEKELMSFKEACEFLGCSASALNKWKADNTIPYKKLGKRVFFSRSEINNVLKQSNYNKLKELQ